MIGVVGGGIVGLAVARRLAQTRPDDQVVVLEKETRVATHQTGHNSGVVHAGIYYRPGSLKAELCTRGRHLLKEYCAEHSLPYQECGKLVVAVDRGELGRFEALEQTATENGVPGLRRVEGRGIQEIEPHARGLVALHSPATAITEYVAVAGALAADIETAGGEVRLGTEVVGIRTAAGGGVEVALCRSRGEAANRSVQRFDAVVVCAGLQSDRTARLAGGDPDPRIVPFRGEYLNVTAAKQGLVHGMVYPVPDPRYPFLGVHFTRRVDGGLEVGPNAVLATKREGYRRSDIDVDDLRATLAWPGFWRLARRHWRTGVEEVLGSISMRMYLRSAQRYVPDIGVDDVRRGGAGVRAQAVGRDGSLLDDFVITSEDGVTSVRNAPSPAATSSLAIAEWVVDRL